MQHLKQGYFKQQGHKLTSHEQTLRDSRKCFVSPKIN
jgi:hypothetical protein